MDEATRTFRRRLNAALVAVIVLIVALWGLSTGRDGVEQGPSVAESTTTTTASAVKPAVVALVETTTDEEEDEFGPDWPQGPGREDVGYFCAACHSLAIVKQQGLSRAGWDELFDWMIEDQGMPELESAERELYLDYLAANFGIPE